MENTAQLSTGSEDGRDSNESWLEFYRCYFNFTYHLCLVPFRITTDPVGKRPQITTKTAQRVICFSLQCFSLLFIRKTSKEVWDYMQEGTDPVSYFDLMLIILLDGIDLLFKYTFWGRMQQFTILLDELSNEKRLRVWSSWRPWKVRILVYSICTLYLFLAALYVALLLGVDPSDTSELIGGMKANTKAIFGAWATSSGTFALAQHVAAVACALYTSAFWGLCEVFELVSVLFWYRVTNDFFDAVERGDIDDLEVVSQYEKFKGLNKKFNSVAGLIVNYWLCYPIFYYATHLVDMLNNSDLNNRFTMCIFLGNLSISLILAAKTNLRAKETMTSWIRRHGFPLIDAQRLQVILFDLHNCSIGIGTFFTVTMSFAANIVDRILTLAVITIQLRL